MSEDGLPTAAGYVRGEDLRVDNNLWHYIADRSSILRANFACGEHHCAMADLPNNERDQLELFPERHSRPRAHASRDRGTTRKQSPAGRELAELADLVAERVLEALASPDAPASGGSALPSGTLLTADEVAELLGVTSAWIYGQSRRGRIPTVKLGRYYRYRLDAIEAWITEQEDAA